MAYPENMNMPTAVSARSQHDLSAPHITTADFMQFNVAKCIEMVPDQSLDIEHNYFCRLDALPSPTMGRAVVKNRAYFVPYRTIFPMWNSFINDTPYIGSNGDINQISSVYLVDYADLSFILRSDTYSSAVADGSAYDFKYVVYGNTGTDIAYTSYANRNFTPRGRQIYKLLRSLGYGVDFSNRPNYTSALPLLALCRVYLDFYYPSQYANDENSSRLDALLRRDTTDPGELYLNRSDLELIFNVVSALTYDSDYFTSAWDNANAPNDALASNVQIADVDSMTDFTSNAGVDVEYDASVNKNAPVINSSDGTISTITQFALNALRSLSDYMKRNQLAGSRALDRYLARFGVKLPSEKLNRSVKVGEFFQYIYFGDVISTSDTSGAQLGDYAGKGISNDKGYYRVSSEGEYGMLIIVSTIIPQVDYYQGILRHTKHVSRLDFWTPEFDSLGTQAVGCDELFVPVKDDKLPNGYRERIFGFTPRYAEYKIGNAQITGDFVCDSINSGMDSWYLARDMRPYIEQIGGMQNLRHNFDFVRSLDSAQYNRIFYNVSDDADHIKVRHDFVIKSSFPGKSLFNTYEFKDEDKSQKVTMPVGGTQSN